MDQVVLWQIAIGGGGFLAGLLIGFGLRRPDRRLRTQVEELESQLQETRRQADQHRARVEKHFERTSELFRDLTEQYTALYAHLAEGARELCDEGGPALGRGLNDPLLAATFGVEAPYKPAFGPKAADEGGEEPSVGDESSETAQRPPTP
jgi:hypothetical protein